jgi:hypothetical protein
MMFNKSRAGDLIRQGHLLQAVLLDSEGLLIDAAGERYEPEKLSSVYFSVRTLAADLERELDITEVLEFSFRMPAQRMRLNIRHVPSQGQDLILICLLPIPLSHMPTLRELLMS